MANPSNNDDLRQSVAELQSRIEHIDAMLDSEKRLVRSARLVERVIKRHFMRDSTEKLGLRTLIQMRKRFLGKRVH